MISAQVKDYLIASLFFGWWWLLLWLCHLVQMVHAQ